MSFDTNVRPFRMPRIQAQINSLFIISVLYAEINAPGYGNGSDFVLCVKISEAQIRSGYLNEILGVVTVRITISDELGAETDFYFEGLANSVSFDPIKKIITIKGRDYSSLFMASAVQQSFSNLTASEVVAALSSAHGLVPVITPTSSLIGSYRAGNHNQMLLNAHSAFTNEWDLLRFLAKTEDFNLLIDGRKVIFEPAFGLTQSYATLDLSNVTDIRFRRKCPLSRQDKIIIKSWNTSLNQSILYEIFEKELSESADLSTEYVSPISENVILKPNLSTEEAETWARKCRKQSLRQSTIVDISMVGETSLRPGVLLKVSGSGTYFDQSYVISGLRRHFSPSKGFSQNIRAFTAEFEDIAKLYGLMQ